MKYFIFAVLLLESLVSFSQPDSVLIKKKQKNYMITGASAFYGLSVLGMNELWYKNYKRSSFHWVDDSREWLQMDKTGHFLFTYMAARTFSGGLESVGVSKNKSLIYASGIAMLGISTIEVFDGFSEGWGASASDLIANTSGVALFVAQSYVWNEEKIIPKISWHPTKYAALRPEILGGNFPERLLKDYNGHTLWLSFNLKSLSGLAYLPPWLCLSVGYGAEGMISGYNNPALLPHFERYRQYYLSFDADLKKINTGSKTINKLLHSLNFIKVPFPALIFNSKGVKIHRLYF